MVMGETIAAMSEFSSQNKTPFSWADTPWTVAALLGVWGVLMGVEEFFLANIFMVLAGASCVVRRYKDNIHSKPHRRSAFVLGLAIIVAIVGVDIHLTAKKKESSEAKAREIPGLHQQIQDLQGTINVQNAKLNQSQGQSDQKLADISQENKDLKKSVEAKDAALIAIAKQQLNLSFVPAVDITHETGRLHIFNKGKTTIRIWGDKYGSDKAIMEATPMAIPPTGAYDLFSEKMEKLILAQIGDNGEARVPFELYLSTEDEKKHVVLCTFWEVVKDSKLTINTQTHGIEQRDWTKTTASQQAPQ
jgi:hypothetical protein